MAAIDLLLVEDSADDVELTLHAIRQHGLTNRVQVARDGEEAIAALFGSDADAAPPCPALVLLDLKLPRLDGFEVLQRIRSDPRTRATPVTVLTSSNHDRDITRCYELGANSYVVKPVDFPEFIEAVRATVSYWLELNEAPPERGAAAS